MSQMKFFDDVDLGLCELQNHLLHIVGASQTGAEGQLAFNTGSTFRQMEYYDGTSIQVPITALRVGDGDGGSQGISGDRQADIVFTGTGITVDAASTSNTVEFTNDHQTIQSMTDLSTTPGAGNDGYALLWNNGSSAFELVDLATVTVSGSFVTTNTDQTVGGQKTFSDPAFFQDTAEFQDDVVINGNLTVSGAHILTQPETVIVEDNLMFLNSNHTGAPTQDAGFLINRGSSTNVGLIWDETSDQFILIFTNDDGTAASPTPTGKADLAVQDFNAAGNGVVTGTLDLNSTLILNDDPNPNTLNDDSEFLVRNEGSSEVEKVLWSTIKDNLGTKVTGTITGNGILTSFTFTHNIGSVAVDITLIEDSTGDKVYTTCRNISTTQSQISFKYAVPSLKTYTVIAQ